MNAFAVSYSGKAKLTLTAADNESCAIVIAESADFSDGLNNGYYAEFNDEGKDVQLYVVYGGVKYAHFASNTLTASNVTGSLKIKFAGVEYTIDAAGVVFSDLALAANSVLPAAGDEANYVVNPSAPAVPGICNNYDKLQITGYAGGAQLEVLNYADKASVFTETVAGDNVEIDLEAKGLTANTQYFVKLTPAGATAALEYVIKFKPAVTIVP